MTTERDVEQAFVREAKRFGATVLKFTSPGHAGMPDRAVLLRYGVVRFVEFKAPGKKPRPLQRKTFERLEELGFPVLVIDSLEQAQNWWAVRKGTFQ
jgi:hypothetical protein